MNAVVGRWQQERLREAITGSDDSRNTMPISANRPMSSALRAAVGSEAEETLLENILDSGDHSLWRALSLFEMINRGSEDIISIHDAKGQCLYVSDACIDILGLTRKSSWASAVTILFIRAITANSMKK